MRKKIPVADPYITREDVRAVAQAIKNKRLSQGQYVDRFEREFASYLGRKHALAAMNGTAALHLAIMSVGVKPGDEVIVPSFTFIATSNCVLYAGAKPVFVDIDPNTYNIDPEKIERLISPRTKAIIPVHYAGQPADMDPILEIAERRGLCVIEDAAEAHGATYKNRKAGAIGELGCFSFYPNKNMTTGEGGMLATDDDEIAEKVRLLRSHGQDSRYHHVTIGYNYRMTDMQAALGMVQLRRLDRILRKKREAAEYYGKLLLG
nr:DegT/DnrJ/EryC1/StrS family aminotransferase [Candidatus Njordarchaeum guaymaensis]